MRFLHRLTSRRSPADGHLQSAATVHRATAASVTDCGDRSRGRCGVRLQSHHDNSRRDGAYTLGRLRICVRSGAVELLKVDDDTDVRAAAATALGEIGDPRAVIYLERVTIYDKKQKVRDAAAVALSRMPREVIVPQTSPQPVPMAPQANPPAGTPSYVVPQLAVTTTPDWIRSNPSPLNVFPLPRPRSLRGVRGPVATPEPGRTTSNVESTHARSRPRPRT